MIVVLKEKNLSNVLINFLKVMQLVVDQVVA